MSFVWLSEETVPFPLYIVNRLVFFNNRSEVFTARYDLSLYITRVRFVLKGFNKQPRTTDKGWRDYI